MGHTVLYMDKLNPAMEQMLLEMCPKEVDLRFLQPNIGKPGAIEEAETMLVTTYNITKEIMDQAKGLKLIQRTGVGLDNVDVEYATKKGIPVSICKGFNKVSVAELAILLMLALYRRIVPLDPLTKKGEWHTWTYRHVSYELFGKTVGVIGAGAVGQEVIKRLRAFETNILYYDPFRLPEEKEEELGIRYAELETVLEQADIITLHLPLLPATRDLITMEQFKKMKPSAVLINTARGPIVNQKDLVEALRSGEIAGAASDVFSSEPADPNDPLFQLENVNLITTPHLGAATYDNYHRVFQFSLANARRVVAGEPVEGVINKV